MEVHQRTGFLGLPSDVRQRILSFAGLVRSCPVVITRDGSEHYHILQANRHRIGSFCRYQQRLRHYYSFLESVPRPECSCDFFPKQLFLVSRAVSEDALRVLYGQNDIIVRPKKPQELEVVRSLSKFAIASITRLMVRLNTWPCPMGHSAHYDAKNICLVCRRPTSLCTSPLNKNQENGKAMIEQWKQTCLHLASAIVPGQVDFTFISDVDDLDTAKDILLTLKDLPQLKKCTIRLGRLADAKLQSLARQASLELTGTWSHSLDMPFRYLDLPTEVRHNILQYTHFGSKGDYGLRRGKKHIRIENNKRVHLFPMNEARCCWNCTFADCCCPSRYAAYSQSCDCRILPSILLSISSQTYGDALRVLFSSNCFVFYQEPRLTLEFFRRYQNSTRGRNHLSSFRHIQLWLTESMVHNFNEIRQDWEELMLLISNHFNLSCLFLDIYTDDEDWCIYRCTDLPKVYDVYMQLTRSLRPLCKGRLLEFHIHFGWYKDLERVIEKSVMGDALERRTQEGRFKRTTIGCQGREFYELPDWHKDEYFFT